MRRKQYFKLMHINLTKDLADYLNWKSTKLNRNISEVVRNLIANDLVRNESVWLQRGTINCVELQCKDEYLR